MTIATEYFRFREAGPLVDGELELVLPGHQWVDALLASAHHPMTQQLAPAEASVTRDHLDRYLREHPMGRQRPDSEKGIAPAYAFWMRLDPRTKPPVPIAGGVTLRVGHTENLECFIGQIGYGVYPPARGNHYAERAVRLLMPLARLHGLNPLWITCNPDNWASRRTCERLGGRMIEIVNLPRQHPLYLRGEHQKCRYRIEL